MKKTFCNFLAIALLLPMFASAVTWQLDSGPFLFPGTSILKDKHVNTSQIAIRCSPFVSKGVVTIQYTVPPGISNATLRIYNLCGMRIEAFDLQPGANTIHWSIANHTVAAGIYLAVMRCGTIERKIPISIVK